MLAESIVVLLALAVLVLLIMLLSILLTHLQGRKKEPEEKREAQELVEAAEHKAAEIVKEAHVIADGAEDSLEKALDDASDAQEKALSQAIDSHVKAAAGKLDELMEREWEQGRAAIVAFRKKEEARIAQELTASIPETIKKVAGRSIPLALHEDMVLDALREVQKEGLFSQKTKPKTYNPE